MSRRDRIPGANGDDDANVKSIEKNLEITRHHVLTIEQTQHVSEIRGAAKQFLDAIDQHCPMCADSTYAKRQARMAMFSAMASIELDGMV